MSRVPELQFESAPRVAAGGGRGGWLITLGLLLASCGSGSGGADAGAVELGAGDDPLPSAQVAEPWSHDFDAAGEGTLVWSLRGGRLPSGLSLDTSSGVIEGTPQREEAVSFTLRVTNGIGSDEQTFSLVVEAAAVGAPQLITERLPEAAVGVAYSQPLLADGAEPRAWSVTRGVLPAGLVLSPATGIVAGTPTAAGSVEIEILVRNAVGQDLGPVWLTVQAQPEAPVITAPEPTLPDATLGALYAQAFLCSGTAPVTWSVVSGSLPPGLSMASNGLLLGLPSAIGTFQFTLQVENLAGSDQRTFTLDVARRPTLTAVTPDSAPRGASVRLAGTGFSTTPSDHQVSFGAQPGRVLAATPTELLVEVPGGIVGSVDVVVAIAGESTDVQPFTGSSQVVRYVDAGADGGIGDGSSWSDAFTKLQDALAVSESDDHIWVAAGSYKPGSDRAATFTMVDGIRLLGGFAGTEGSAEQSDPVAHVCVLTGDLQGDDSQGLYRNDNAHHVLTSAVTATVDGFTVCDGEAVDSAAETRGAGLLVTAGDLTLRRMVFADHRSSRGAVAVLGGRVTLTDSRCEGNTATLSGGALFLAASGSVLQRVVLVDNSAAAGGAIDASGADWMATDCVLVGNSATQDGGAVRITALVEQASMVGCTWFGNAALAGGDVWFDGDSGAGLQLGDCILWGAQALTGVAIRTTGTVALDHCILVGGVAAIALDGDGAVDDQGGNSSDDPRFVDAADGAGADHRWATRDDGLMPAADSPALDQATRPGNGLQDVTGTARPQGSGIDLGAYERQQQL